MDAGQFLVRAAAPGLAMLVTLLAPAGGTTRAAWAEAPDSVAATESAREGLIRGGSRSHAAGEHRAALDSFQGAARLRMTPSLRYLLATEQQELGLLADSFANAVSCGLELELESDSDESRLFAPLCAEMQAQLQPRVATLTVDVSNAPAEVDLRINGRPLRPALFGVPIVIMPGQVVVEARAPGRLALRQEFTAFSGERHHVMAALAASPLAAVPSMEVAPGPALVAGKGGAAANWGLRLAVAGGTLLAASGVVWLTSEHKFRDLRATCDLGRCTRADVSSQGDTIRLLDRLSLTGAIAGGALLLAGSAWPLFANDHPGQQHMDDLYLAIGLVAAGLTVVAAVYSIAVAGDDNRFATTSSASLARMGQGPGGFGALLAHSPVGRF